MRGAIRWVVRRYADVPEGDAWLTGDELRTLAGLVVPKRRADWRLGRFAAKAALRAVCPLGVPSIRARDDGSPEALVDGAPAPWSISISHSAGVALVAVAREPIALGCDLEVVEPRAPALVEQFFTAGEQARAAGAGARRDELTTLVWSAKESALKAIRTGLRVDTRDVEVSFDDASSDGGWRGLRADFAPRAGGASMRGAWQRDGDLVLTLVAAPWPDAPPVPVG